jgi:Tfp pilus assembly protein PilO
MLTNLTVVAVLISVAWLGLMGYYIYLSQQQDGLEQELNALKKAIADKERGQNE